MKINTQKKTIKKLLSAVLTASIITTSFSSIFQASAQTIDEASNQTITEIQTSESPDNVIREFSIYDKNEFLLFMKTPLFWKSNYTIKLKNNIDMQGATCKPIEEFSGQFDGCGHTVSNLSVKGKAGIYKNYELALIKTLNSSAEIKNITFENYTIKDIINININSYKVAGLVSNNKGTISDVDIKNGKFDNISERKFSLLFNKIENYKIAGFVGTNSGKIIKCTTTISVDNVSNAGGFVSENRGNIENCISKGNVSGYECVGGFCSNNWGEIKSCNAEGSIKATTSIIYLMAGGLIQIPLGKVKCGGFVGNNKEGTIDGCTATGEAISEEYVGGFAGINKAKITKCTATGKAIAKTKSNTALAGGFVGKNEKGKISYCTAEGGAESSSTHGQAKAGGFVGVNKARITNSKAYTKTNNKIYLESGTSHKDNGCGGFVGKNDKGGNVDGCYAECTVETTKKNKGGGFVGEAKNKSEIYDSSCKTKRVIKKKKKEDKEDANFCYKKDKKAVIKGCYDNIKKK